MTVSKRPRIRSHIMSCIRLFSYSNSYIQQIYTSRVL